MFGIDFQKRNLDLELITLYNVVFNADPDGMLRNGRYVIQQ